MRFAAHRFLTATLASAIFVSGFVACDGCRPSKTPASGDPGPPTVRLYVVSDLAGALEPCGCVKDQLGGLDHAAAWIAKERTKAEGAILLAAGPLFFMDPVLKEERAAQEKAKAETMAKSIATLGFAALAPGRNEWAAGTPQLQLLMQTSGGALAAANLSAPPPTPWIASVVKEVHGTKVGIIGVAAPDRAEDAKPIPDLTVGPATDAVKAEVGKVKAGGAQIVVVLAAVGRGEAKRIADIAPDVTAIVVGSPGGSGEANTETPPAERVGNVVVVETGNHLQTLGVLDFYVKDGKYNFADGSGLENAQKRASMTRQIDELRGRIAMGNKDEETKKRLDKLESDRKSLDDVPPPQTGSFFKWQAVEVRESLGRDEAVKNELTAYYKRVNEMNRIAFANKLPRPSESGDSYSGEGSCTTCHKEAKAVWDKTPHSHAYATLANEYKQFNLDCVSCHVTGYDEPGGSTVVHVEKLENVQCEVCHGPASKHVKNPKTSVPVPKPQGARCLACHHPPHVHEFDPMAKMPLVLGPGHGRPLN
jgi:hypothetical protein